jgi:aminopeptidase
MDHDTYVDRLAALVVELGANVQHDQIVFVLHAPGMEPLTRAIAARAYERGARFVEAFAFDGALKRIRLEHARDETLDFVPSWWGQRLLALGEQRAARIGIAPVPEPGQLEGVDPARAPKDDLLAAHQPERDPHRLHDRLEPSRRLGRDHRRREVPLLTGGDWRI